MAQCKELELTRAPDDFKLVSKLGAGSYGTVYLVLLPDGQNIAVKVVEDSDRYGIKSVAEIDIMSRLIQPNIMPSLGIKGFQLLQKRQQGQPLKQNVSLSIFMPLGLGELMTYIASYKPSIEYKTKLIYDICCGVKFLHDNRILHLDLKPENILIIRSTTPSGAIVDRAVVSDFGLSIYTDDTGRRSYDRELVTITYRAPEAFRKPHVYDRKVDVWSIGIIILYTVLGRKVLFRDWKNTFREIERLFNPAVRKKAIGALLTNADPRYKDLYVDLLDHILRIDPTERYDLDQVMSHPVFINMVCEPGCIKQPRVHPVANCNLLYYRGFDYLIRVCCSMKVLTETVFLAGDLYQRSLHLIDLQTNDIETEWPKIALITLTCFWIADKSIEQHLPKASAIIALGGDIFTVDSLLTTERTIIETLGGIIYRNNLYTASECTHKLLVAFEALRNCMTYPYLDLTAWNEMKVPDCVNGVCTGCSKFTDFYKQTEYFKWADGQKHTPNCDYVQCIFDSDLADRIGTPPVTPERPIQITPSPDQVSPCTIHLPPELQEKPVLPGQVLPEQKQFVDMLLQFAMPMPLLPPVQVKPQTPTVLPLPVPKIAETEVTKPTGMIKPISAADILATIRR